MASKKNYRCPCCGQLTPDLVGFEGKVVHMGPNQQALFNLLKKAPQGLSHEAIRERVFPSRSNGDDYCHNIVAVTTHYVNKKIAQFKPPLKIVSTKGHGSIYRLVRL
jgi:hypothetical protein